MSQGEVIQEAPECCGRKTVSVNCFDHREWLCIVCRKKHGLAPFYEPEWESMTIGAPEKPK